MLKKLNRTKVTLSAFMLVAFAGLAFSQGQGFWSNFPIIGGAAYCSSTNNSTCTNTVPAGPTITGNETFPVDTNTSTLPATAKLKAISIGIGPYTYNAPATGAVLNVSANIRRLVLEPAGTIANLTINMDNSGQLVDGQLFSLCTTQIVTALTLNAGSGTTMLGKPTALLVPVTTGAASCVGWIYRVTNTTWYRVQ